MNDDKWLELPEPAPHGCDCCDPTSPSPDPVVVRLEAEVDELRKQLNQTRVCLAKIALSDTDDMCWSDFAHESLGWPKTSELWDIVKSGDK